MSANKLLARSSIAALAMAAFAVPAMAADVVYEEPPAPEPQPVVSTPVSEWTGPYAGVQFGYARGSVDAESGGVADSADTNGWLGGVFGGYQMQNGSFVYGAEADVNYSGLNGTSDGGSFDARSRFDGSLRGRAGVAVTNDVLIYGTAGVAGERLRMTENATGDQDTNMMVGYTVGAGVDAKLTEQVFARGEYRYTDYGSRDFEFASGTTADADSSNHRFMVGLGVKF